MLSRRHLWGLLLSMAGLGAVHAQPTAGKPLRLIVPYAAGGPIDVTARVLAERVKDSLGPVIVAATIDVAAAIIAESTLSFLGLGALLGIIAVEPVQPGASVGVDQGDAGLFLLQMAKRGQQRDVLEHVRMVGGMEGVAVTEHAAMVTPAREDFRKSLIFRIMAGFAALLWLRGEDSNAT